MSAVQTANSSQSNPTQSTKRRRASRFVRTRQSDVPQVSANLVDADQYTDENKTIFAGLTSGVMTLVKRTSKRGKPTKSKAWQLFRLVYNTSTKTINHDRVFCVGCVKLFQ